MKPNLKLLTASLVVSASALTFVTGAFAQAAGVTEYVRNGKTIDKITCQDFAATEDKFKPETLSYAIGYGKHGHAKDAVVDVGGINKLVPVVVQACTAHPTDSLLARLATMGK